MHYLPHLSKDKKLKKLIEEQGSITLKKQNNIYLHLCASILSQQLSVRVAEVIYQRFLKLFKSLPGPEEVLLVPTENLRAIGLSAAKASYIQNVSRFALEQGMDAKKLKRMSNQELIEYLTQIKGVGKWTVEMQLMFTLAREDVFPADDLGIQLAMIKLYQLDASNKKAFKLEMEKISNKWIPFRTYACLHLWRYKDSK